MRPKEGGRNVLCRLLPSVENSVVEEVTPPESNVRTRVHEYGGGAFVLGKSLKEETVIFYSEFVSQRLCRVMSDTTSTSSNSMPITPDTTNYRYADGVITPDGKIMYCIREDHTNPEPKYVVNELVSINLEDGTMNVIATGNDFYAAPRLSSDGSKLAYVTWNHPNMPWDAIELRMVDLSSSSSASSKSEMHTLIAGKDGDTSAIQPIWHPHTGELYYISDQSGYYNIFRAGCDQSILPMEYDFGGSSPGWTLGRQDFTFLPTDGLLVAQYTKDGNTVLVVADVVSQKDKAVDVQEYSGDKDGLPRMFGGIVPSDDDDDSNTLYFLGGTPSVPTSIYKWNLDARSPATVLTCSSNLTFPEDVISAPEQIEFPTTLGTAYGYYYPPKNGGFTCTTEKAPPLLVKAHGK
jgi:dipeptidyl aminopeptidase/acylaminoacyl peptidase